GIRDFHVTGVQTCALPILDDYRILIIRAGEQLRFDTIQTLGDLRKKTGGMGSHWVDAEIMRANGLPIISAVDYRSLFKMLRAGRSEERRVGEECRSTELPK